MKEPHSIWTFRNYQNSLSLRLIPSLRPNFIGFPKRKILFLDCRKECCCFDAWCIYLLFFTIPRLKNISSTMIVFKDLSLQLINYLCLWFPWKDSLLTIKIIYSRLYFLLHNRPWGILSQILGWCSLHAVEGILASWIISLLPEEALTIILFWYVLDGWWRWKQKWFGLVIWA